MPVSKEDRRPKTDGGAQSRLANLRASLVVEDPNAPMAEIKEPDHSCLLAGVQALRVITPYPSFTSVSQCKRLVRIYGLRLQSRRLHPTVNSLGS